MENLLSNLTEKLRNDGFKFEASKVSYNPMERFADYVSTKEIVHSKIIADLLNPAGEHQLGDGFLVNFLNKLNINVSKNSLPDAKNPLTIEEIKTEYSAPASEMNGRIDIFVRLKYLKKCYALIIENKLNNAGDQPQQLPRYNEFVKKKFPDYERVTVYMPCNGSECKVYEKAIIVNATDLADIIDDTLKESIALENYAIQAYSKYLRNISINNVIMANAMKLAEMSAEDIQNAKAIKNAYDVLPQSFACKLKSIMNEYEAKIADGYPHYCYIWEKAAYRATGLWLAIGFYHDSYRIYVVSEDKSKLEIPEFPVIKSQEAKGYAWLISPEQAKHEIRFNGAPVWDDLKKTVDKWIKVLHEIADKYENSPSFRHT